MIDKLRRERDENVLFVGLVKPKTHLAIYNTLHSKQILYTSDELTSSQFGRYCRHDNFASTSLECVLCRHCCLKNTAFRQWCKISCKMFSTRTANRAHTTVRDFGKPLFTVYSAPISYARVVTYCNI